MKIQVTAVKSRASNRQKSALQNQDGPVPQVRLVVRVVVRRRQELLARGFVVRVRRLARRRVVVLGREQLEARPAPAVAAFVRDREGA